MKAKYKSLIKFNIVFILIGVGSIWIGYDAYLVAKDSEDWTAVDATVIASWVDDVKFTGPEPTSDVRPTIVPGETSYFPHIKYNFTVNSQLYLGTSWYAGEVNSAEDTIAEAEARIADYPPGTVITIYYDSSNPDNNTVFKGVHLIHFVFQFIGIVFLGWALVSISIIILISLIRWIIKLLNRKKCKRCGTKNLQKELYCKKCGVRI